MEEEKRIELLSDGGMAVIDTRSAAVCSLSDVFGGTYLAQAGLIFRFPFADPARAPSAANGDCAARVLSRERQRLRLLLARETPAAVAHPFELHVQFELEGAALKMGCMLSNPAQTPLPFFLGADIALHSPVQAGDEAADYEWTQENDGTAVFQSRRSGRGMRVKADGFTAINSPEKAENTLRVAIKPGETTLAPLCVLRARLELEML